MDRLLSASTTHFSSFRCAKKKKIPQLHLNNRHFRPRFSTLLARSCSKKIASLSVRRVSQSKLSSSQPKPLPSDHADPLCENTATQTRFHTHTAAIPIKIKHCSLPVLVTRSTVVRFKVLSANHETSCACTLSRDPNALSPCQHSFSPPAVFVIQISSLITRWCNHRVGVAMCLIRPAQLRIAMTRPAVASNWISMSGVVNAVSLHFTFDFNSLLLQHHAQTAQHWSTANPSSCCLDSRVEVSFCARETYNRLCC